MHKAIKFAIAIAVVGSVIFSVTHKVHAQTAPVKTPALAPVSFAGPSIGIDINAMTFENTSVSTDTKYFGSDLGGAARVGYGFQNSQGWYVGGEASEGTKFGVTRNAGVKDSTGNEFVLDAKAGKVYDSNLIYGKVGYALTDITEQNTVDGNKNSGVFNGIRFGGGVERFLSEKVTGRVEVIYTDYSARTFDNNQVDPSNISAKVGFSYQLD